MSCTLLTFSIFYTLIGWSFDSCIVYSLIIVVYKRKWTCYTIKTAKQKGQFNTVHMYQFENVPGIKLWRSFSCQIYRIENNTPVPVINLATKTEDLEKLCSHWDWFHLLLMYSLTPVTKRAKINQSPVFKSTLHKGQWLQKEQWKIRSIALPLVNAFWKSH